MASNVEGGTLPPNFLLTPQQQDLLFAALNSNKQQGLTTNSIQNPIFAPANPKARPNGNPDSSLLQDDSFLDNYDYDFGDSSFDFSFAGNDTTGAEADADGVNDDLESPENELSEKRSHPDDDEDEDSPGNDAKRRESGDKLPKKPGRKPLTSEPSSVCCMLSNVMMTCVNEITPIEAKSTKSSCSARLS